MKKVGHTLKFFLVFIDELGKQLILTVEEGGQKNKQNNFNIYNVASLKTK